jgi:hypothetical protein
MDDAEWLTSLYDRAAQRYGHADHDAWLAAGVDPVAAEQIARREAKAESDARRWAQAQLRD